MKKSIDDIDFAKNDGLVPVIVQDANTKDVLTLAYSNKESLDLTPRLVRCMSALCSPMSLSSTAFETNVEALGGLNGRFRNFAHRPE